MSSDAAKPPESGPTTGPDGGPPLSDEVSLADIDRILQEDDPEFSKELGEIQSVGVEAGVIIESAVAGEEILPVDQESGRSRLLSRFPILEKLSGPLAKVRAKIYTPWLRFRSRVLSAVKGTWVYSRTLPTEFFGYLKAMASAISLRLSRMISIFRSLSWPRKLAWLAFGVMLISLVILLRLNMMGTWLPNLYRAQVRDLTVFADKTWPLGPKDQWIQLFRAFPQEEIEYLFPKMVVNLRPSPSHPNPMGAFEFFAVLDSRDAALEAQARKTELHDRLQRALEDQSYIDLSNPLGKKRVKDIMRSELNQVLTQGWVKDVLIKTMVLKP